MIPAETARSNPAVLIFESFDVVINAVITGLHFNKNQIFISRILNAVLRFSGDVNRVSGKQMFPFTANRGNTASGDDKPVLRTMMMTLKA